MQIETEAEFFVPLAGERFVADEQVAGVVGREFGGEGFEGDFRADAGGVTECDGNASGHARGRGRPASAAQK